MTKRQFTLTKRVYAGRHITTGLSMRQLLREVKKLKTGETWEIEERTKENDPMRFGP